jgi:hypothetical protein
MAGNDNPRGRKLAGPRVRYRARVLPRRLVCALAMAASLAVVACGSGKSSSSTSRVDFKSGFATNHKDFGALVTEIARDIKGAGSKSDADLAKEFGDLATRADQEASQLSDLTTPSKYSKRVTSLVAGFHAVKTDLSRIATAATKNDAASAQAAARALLADAAKVKTADTSLSKDLGLTKPQS